MKTLYKILALLIITPFLIGTVMFVSSLVFLLGLIGWLYGTET